MDKNNDLRESHVIVRAWGDEPVKLVLYAIDIEGLTATVGDPTAKRPIRIPSEQVFPFDGDAFQAAKAAYESGDAAALASVYAGLDEIKRTCILIPVEIQSSHDQERIAHPEGAPAGSDQ